jgi:hypothetical protein
MAHPLYIHTYIHTRVDLLSPFHPQYEAIFFLAFMDHVFLSVDNITFVWELFLMASSADVLNCPSFHVFSVAT